MPEGISDARLARLLYPESDSQPGALEDPDWPVVHMELQRKGVTRHLLWEEYCQQLVTVLLPVPGLVPEAETFHAPSAGRAVTIRS